MNEIWNQFEYCQKLKNCNFNLKISVDIIVIEVQVM